MAVIYQSPAHPERMSFALKDLIEEDLYGIRVAVAYATRAGCERLISNVKDKLGREVSSEVSKLLVTSLDFGHTEPGALSYWKDLPNGEVRIANVQRAAESISLTASSTNFHPKAYLFDYPHRVAALIGSANLTRRALSVNTEAAIAEASADVHTVEEIWTESWGSGEALTGQLLEEYGRVRPNRSVPDLDSVTQNTGPLAIGRRIRLIDAIDQGLNPSQFQCLWIQAGSMSSGGSRNQLELPRGANLFFGFDHTTYPPRHLTIGHPVLISRGHIWIDRTITWHAGGGQNAMERLNLPTVAQGGHQYANSAVLFRRTLDGFELTVTPWGSDRSDSWVRASAEKSRLFRTGLAANSRKCGLLE